MGALANAAALRKDLTFREWVEAAIVYQARLVLIGDANVPAGTTEEQKRLRHQLARTAAVAPGSILDLCVTAIASDPTVATKGATAALVSEVVILDKIAEVWTSVATITYPNG